MIFLACKEGITVRQPHAHGYVVLDQSAQRFPRGCTEILVVSIGDGRGFGASNFVLGEVHVHFITIEVSVVRRRPVDRYSVRTQKRWTKLTRKGSDGKLWFSQLVVAHEMTQIIRTGIRHESDSMAHHTHLV